jgi:histidyl-tRNA synthetase
MSNLMQNFTGCIDYNPAKFANVQNIIRVIRNGAKILNTQEIDTPAIEYRDLLLKKYGDEAESKLIFNVDDKASLRYDLTVPFERYMVQNGLDELRRFQVGKVYRKDTPYPESGRFCEFYQADIDIVGNYPELTSEVEIMWLIKRTLEAVGLKDYTIKYNYRQNLVDMCKRIGITRDKEIKNICISIDKLDKVEWEIVEKELRETRDLSLTQCSYIKWALKRNKLAESLQESDSKFRTLCNNDKLVFDASLARGLDYYTGIIYEVVVPDSKIKTIIAGGRYDKLIYKKKKNGQKVYLPAIGISFGISRMCLLTQELFNKEQEKIATERTIRNIYVISKDNDIRMRLCAYFRNRGLIVSYEREQRKIIKSITYAVKNNYRYVAIYGESDNKIKIKEIANNDPDLIFEFDKLDTYEFR